MQPRGLLIAVLALVALSAGIWWSNKTAEDPAKKDDKKSIKLVDLLASDLVDVSIQHNGQPPLLLHRDTATNQWSIVAEPKVPTDNEAAATLVTNASTLPTDKLVDENSTDLAQFGLEPARIVIELKDKKGKVEKVFVGDDSPVGNMVYARKPNEKKVYAIANFYKTGFDKTVNDLRDKRMMRVDEAKLARLELQRKTDTLEFGKNAKGDWQIVKPQPYRTDNLAVAELLRKAKDIKYDPALNPVEAKKNLTDFAASTPVATLKATDAAGVQSLEIRKTKDNAYLAKSNAVEGVFKATEELGKGLDKSLDDFRLKKLLEFGFDDPSRIEIKNGAKTTVIEHKGEDWLLGGKKMDPASVMPVIDALRGWTALNFAKAAVKDPFFEVTVIQKDGKSAEKLLVSKSGNFHYAKRDGGNDEYEIDPKTLTDLDAALKAIKEPTAKK